MTSRRQFFRTASLASAAAILTPRMVYGETTGAPLRVFGEAGHRPPGAPPVSEDPRLRALADTALAAAKAAGAQYADVRFTITRKGFVSHFINETEHVAVGVRALVNGAWGFVAGPSWTDQEAARLGAQAARQAAQNKWKTGEGVELAAVSSIAKGSWSTPIKRDPFSVSKEELYDFSEELGAHATSHSSARLNLAYSLSFGRQERTIATTDGAFCTQVFHTMLTQSSIKATAVDPVTQQQGKRDAEWITASGGGFELLSEIDWGARINVLCEEAIRAAASQPTDIGLFDVVLDGYAMADLVASSLGEPLELDRARGFEANAGGTSYLAPPAEILGRKIGPAHLSIHANRSMPGGTATARWDDEGVESEPFTLVSEGVVTDYSTTRQHANFLADYYRTRGSEVRSHGCSGAASAMDFPLVTTPNLVMEPARTSTSFDDLVAGLADGYAIIGGNWDMDQQGVTGQWFGGGAMVYRVKRGKIVAPVAGTGLLIRSLELWKNLQAVGGEGTVRTRGIECGKGQPQFSYSYSVSAPAAMITKVAVVDLQRKYNG